MREATGAITALFLPCIEERRIASIGSPAAAVSESMGVIMRASNGNPAGNGAGDATADGVTAFVPEVLRKPSRIRTVAAYSRQFAKLVWFCDSVPEILIMSRRASRGIR